MARARLQQPSITLDEQLRFAIGHRQLIQVRYHGNERVAEPHDYGVHKGIERLLVYQLSGAPRPRHGNTTGWRLFDLEKIEACVVLDQRFAGSRGQSHPSHLVWDILYARVT